MAFHQPMRFTGAIDFPIFIVSQLNGIFLKAVRTEAMKGRLDKLGLHATELTPAQLAALVKADYERWIPAIKASGLSLQ